MVEWKAESLRITGFPVGPWTDSVEDTWAALVGTQPEQVNQRPREAQVIVEAPYEGGKLVLAREPKRTDLVWTVDVGGPQTEYPSIGNFPAVKEQFLPLARSLLRRDVALKRIAWGGVLVLPVADKIAGYKRLGEFLSSVKVDATGSSDLVYQINRPRVSKAIDGMRVNRICKWSVRGFRQLSAGLVISEASSPDVAVGPEFHTCRLEFDLNSDAARKTEFTGDQAMALLDEFVAMADEIATLGDVP